MEFTSSVPRPFLDDCPRCGCDLLEDALFCGQCGLSLPEVNPTDPSDASCFSENKSVWEWISPTIRLWVFVLLINGILGLLSHALDVSSPIYDLGAQALSALVILIFCFEDRKQLTPLLDKFGYRGSRSFSEILGSLLFLYLFMWLYFELATSIGFEDISLLADYKAHNWPIWSAFILICLLPGIFEELAFRGYIQTRLERVGDAREALVIQAAMFSVLHILPAVFISHLVIGLILGIVRNRSQSLYPGMLIHIAWNAIVLVEEIYQVGA